MPAIPGQCATVAYASSIGGNTQAHPPDDPSDMGAGGCCCPDALPSLTGTSLTPQDDVFRSEYERLTVEIRACLARHARHDGTIDMLDMIPTVVDECRISEVTAQLLVHDMAEGAVPHHGGTGCGSHYLAEADQKTRDRKEFERLYPELAIRAQFQWCTARRKLRKEIAAGQRHCARCSSTTDLVVDHITSIARGGTNDRENLQVLCSTCNGQKGARG